MPRRFLNKFIRESAVILVSTPGVKALISNAISHRIVVNKIKAVICQIAIASDAETKVNVTPFGYSLIPKIKSSYSFDYFPA